MTTIVRDHPHRPVPTGRWAGLGIVLSLIVAAGCGSGAGAAEPSSTATGNAAVASLPPCAAATPVAVDTSFPDNVPLPPGSLVTEYSKPAGGGTTVVLLAPMTIAELGAYLETAYPAEGLTLGDGEAEPSELEQSFSGDGVGGQITARYVSGCDGVVRVNLVVRSS